MSKRNKSTRRHMRQLRDELEAFKAAQVQNPAYWQHELAESERWSVRQDGSMWRHQADLYRRLSWFQGAVERLAQRCAIEPLTVSQRQGEKIKAIVNHPLEVLLSNPNPAYSYFELMEATISYKKITGHAHWWLNRDDYDEQPTEIWPLPSHRVRVIPDGKMWINHYVFESDHGQEVPIPPWQIVHFRRWNPLSAFDGLSTVEALATIAVGELGMQGWNTRFFNEEAGKVPGILAFADMVDQNTWKQIDRDYREQGQRRGLFKLRGVGKGGVQWIQTAMPQKDMEFLAGRTFNKEEIYSMIAPGLASMLDVNATEANATAGETTFLGYGVYPELVSIGQKITSDLLPAYGPNLVAAFPDVRRKDRALELKEQEAFERSHTIDEVRAKYYETDSIGDERGSLIVRELAASKPAAPPAQSNIAADAAPNDPPPPPPAKAELLVEPKPTLALPPPAPAPAIGPGDSHHTGAMIALPIPAELASMLAIPGGITPDQLHVTIAYLGDAMEFDAADRLQIEAALRVASGYGPIRAMVSGLGRFNTQESDGTNAIYASVDAPCLPDFHRRVMESLATAGIELEPNHGFTPHITLGYIDAGAKYDLPVPPALPVIFDSIMLAWATDQQMLQLRDRDAERIDELAKWERKAIKALKAGKSPAVLFASDVIDALELEAIRDELADAPNVATIKAVFGSAAKASDMTPRERELYDRILAAFQKHGKLTIKAIENDQPIDWLSLDSALRVAMLPLLLEIAMEELASNEAMIGLDVDPALAADQVMSWATTYTAQLIKGLTSTTRDLVEKAITQYRATPGMTRADLERLLDPAFGAKRAEMIAITETTRAASQSQSQYKKILRDAGLNFTRVNRTNADDRVCAICGPLHNKSEKDWPTLDGPPWHPRCRCAVTLELEEGSA
ncbi:phage portal protein [Herpetosiphon geysericola]|uniref:Uncharacterized protein n=1 Tax=Herpetosiphon geysericola TaxID=70996 RepID=A0A0P6YBV1_9CHLR|nr:phage portal protein [Herpetosiphon geysericola]KPL90765.1 hypothetical protein SE18_05205 [Herpetosiphon geysericola]